MLSICDERRGFGRREFLRVGSLALGSMSLPGLLAAKAAAAATSVARDKSVIFLFMQGGPSQIETFDPKMTAPAEIRSATGEVQTTVPGMTFGGTFTKLAQQAHRVSIVRSFRTGDANHDIKPIVSPASLRANLGSLYSRVVGTTHPTTGMPTNALLYPQAVDPSTMPVTQNFGRFADTGLLGAAYAPFSPDSSGPLQESMKLHLARTRLEDRRSLIAQLDRIRRGIDASGAMDGFDKFQQQSFETIFGGLSEAFDLTREDPAVVARYDTSAMVRPEEISRKWNNRPHYIDHGKSLGKLLLLARRLCEAGCGFVTISTNFVWDNHADSNNAGVEEGMRYCGLPFDHAVSTFLEDVHQRGLSDKILLVATGEMGRTPRISKEGGRNHWGELAPLLLSGGGLSMGHVIGQSTRDAGQPLSEPFGLNNLIGTIMHTLFDVGQLRLVRSLPTDLVRTITEGQPITGLM